MFKDVKKGQPVRVRHGNTLYSGDSYFFYLKTNQTCYLYLYQVDASGSIFRIFPNIEFNTPDNLIGAGQQIVLPNPTEVYYLDNIVGHESIYLFASKEEIAAFNKLGTGKRRDIEKECVRLMGPAGVQRRKENIQNAKLKFDTILNELSSKKGFVYVLDFMHK